MSVAASAIAHSRALTLGAYVAAPVLGSAAVVVTALLFPGTALVALIGLPVVLLAAVSPRLPMLVTAVPVLVIVGLAVCALAGTLSVPAAAGVGLLLLGYLLAADLAEITEHRRGMSRLALAGWLRGMLVLLAAGTDSVLALGAIVLARIDLGTALIVISPAALLGAVVVAFGHLHRRSIDR